MHCLAEQHDWLQTWVIDKKEKPKPPADKKKGKGGGAVSRGNGFIPFGGLDRDTGSVSHRSKLLIVSLGMLVVGVAAGWFAKGRNGRSSL